MMIKINSLSKSDLVQEEEHEYSVPHIQNIEVAEYEKHICNWIFDNTAKCLICFSCGREINIKEQMSKIYTPPDKHFNEDGKLVFLAGPILGAEDWQSRAINILHGSDPDLSIANPRRETCEKLSDENWGLQVEWETSHLRLASVYGGILFWLAPEIEHNCERPFAKTTRFEFAEWLTHYKYRKIHAPERPLKIVLGVHDDFPGRDYILHRVFNDCREFVVATTLEETCQIMVDSLK